MWPLIIFAGSMIYAASQEERKKQAPLREAQKKEREAQEKLRREAYECRKQETNQKRAATAKAKRDKFEAMNASDQLKYLFARKQKLKDGLFKKIQEEKWDLKQGVAIDLETMVKNQAYELQEWLIDLIEKHKFNLLREKQKLTISDSYGLKIDTTKWDLSPLLLKEKGAQLTGLTYFYSQGVLKLGCEIFTEKSFEERIKLYKKFTGKSFQQFFVYQVEEAIGKIKDVSTALNDVDKKSMPGVDFEEYCKKILEENDWVVELTPKSGDQGVDLIGSIGTARVCFQCKRHSQPVGNKAVQEVMAGMRYWNGTHAAVVSTSGYTQSAKELSIVTDVKLLAESELAELKNRLLAYQ